MHGKSDKYGKRNARQCRASSHDQYSFIIYCKRKTPSDCSEGVIVPMGMTGMIQFTGTSGDQFSPSSGRMLSLFTFASDSEAVVSVVVCCG